MVVKIDKKDNLTVDGMTKNISDIDETFLNNLFLSLLKKESSIEIEHVEKCGYLGKLFLELKNACKEDSDFYKSYNEIRNQYQEIQEDEKKLLNEGDEPF